MTYQTTIAQQRNFDFFAFFSALYLVISDILLTHTHTHSVANYQEVLVGNYVHVSNFYLHNRFVVHCKVDFFMDLFRL